MVALQLNPHSLNHTYTITPIILFTPPNQIP